MIDINYFAKKMSGTENDAGIPIVNGEHISANCCGFTRRFTRRNISSNKPA